MDKFFNPRSVVVFGVSNKPDNLAQGVIYNLKTFGYKGRIYAVGRSAGECMGLKIHASLDEIQDDLDVAVILTPADTVPEVFRQCVEKGISHVIIESAGFQEYKRELKSVEQELLETARKNGARFIGPNCIGTMNMQNGAILNFAAQRSVPRTGSLGIISQSGGITVWYAHILNREGIGLNKAVSVGNKLNVDEVDILSYYLSDSSISSNLLYLESVSSGRRLMQTARTSKKPIVVYKSNAFPSTARVASSHTAALASDDRVVDAAFGQAGIWRERDAGDLVLAIKAFQLKPMKGNRLMIISRSGGHAVMAADRAALRGFKLVKPPKKFFERINAIAPETRIYRQNPLDIGDVFNLEVYDRIVEEGLRVPGIDGFAFIHLLTPFEESEKSLPIMQKIVDMAKNSSVPVAIGYLVQGQDISPIKEALGYPVFETPDEAIDALAICRDHIELKKRAMRKRRFEKIDWNSRLAASLIDGSGRGLVNADAANRILRACGIPVPGFRLAENAKQALEAAKKTGFPVAVKAAAGQLTHKTESGAVKLDVKTMAGLERACREVQKNLGLKLGMRAERTLLIQRMADPGPEVIVGARRDASFGPVLMLGMGGIFAELLDRVVIRVLPIDRTDAMEMIEELPGIDMLKGARGTKAADLEALADILLRAGQLVLKNEKIRELDLNPVRLYPKKALALDVKIIL